MLRSPSTEVDTDRAVKQSGYRYLICLSTDKKPPALSVSSLQPRCRLQIDSSSNNNNTSDADQLTQRQNISRRRYRYLPPLHRRQSPKLLQINQRLSEIRWDRLS